MDPRRRSLTARVVASVLLAAIALWFAPPVAAFGPASHSCPSPSVVAGPALDATTAHDACDTGSMDWCSLMPGCGAPPPAFIAVAGLVAAAPLPAFATPQATPSDHGRLALSPPTPPPIS